MQALADFFQDLFSDLSFLWTQSDLLEKLQRIFDCERAHLAEVASLNLDLAGFHAEAGSVAIGAGRISAVAAEKHPDVEFVFLAFEMGKETADTQEFAVTVQDEIAMLFVEVDPSHVERNSCDLGIAL